MKVNGCGLWSEGEGMKLVTCDKCKMALLIMNVKVSLKQSNALKTKCKCS